MGYSSYECIVCDTVKDDGWGAGRQNICDDCFAFIPQIDSERHDVYKCVTNHYENIDEIARILSEINDSNKKILDLCDKIYVDNDDIKEIYDEINDNKNELTTLHDKMEACDFYFHAKKLSGIKCVSPDEH
jgi:hypothetical protein